MLVVTLPAAYSPSTHLYFGRRIRIFPFDLDRSVELQQKNTSEFCNGWVRQALFMWWWSMACESHGHFPSQRLVSLGRRETFHVLCYGKVWYGMVWYMVCGTVWNGICYGMGWYMYGMVWYGNAMVWNGMVWYVMVGRVWYGMVWYAILWYAMVGRVWYGMVWYGMACYAMHGMVWYAMVWYGMVCYGMVWYGMVWYAMLCCGNVSQLSTRTLPSRCSHFISGLPCVLLPASCDRSCCACRRSSTASSPSLHSLHNQTSDGTAQSKQGEQKPQH